MIAYFLSHPIQYFTPLFQELAEKTELEVYYYSDCSVRGGIDKGFGQKVLWDIPLLSGYPSVFLRNLSNSDSMNCRLFDAINLSIPGKVRATKASVIVVNGWSYFSDWLVLISAFLFGKEVWMRIETPFHQEAKKSGFKQKLKSFILQELIFKKLVRKFLYIGSQNRKFYESKHVHDDRLVYAPYSVDNQKFRKAYESLIGSKAEMKERRGIKAGQKVILFCGKYIHQKRPFDLLRAFAALKDDQFFLIMLGEGQLRAEMETYISETQLSNVLLTGFVNQGQIAEYYVLADLFVMTSGMGETWGLAVNEAMNFNLPVIVSKTCGCSYDLVEEGKNGFTYTEGAIEDLTEKIRYCLSNDTFREKAGAVSSEIVSRFSTNVIVENMIRAYSESMNVKAED